MKFYNWQDKFIVAWLTLFSMTLFEKVTNKLWSSTEIKNFLMKSFLSAKIRFTHFDWKKERKPILTNFFLVVDLRDLMDYILPKCISN